MKYLSLNINQYDDLMIRDHSLTPSYVGAGMTIKLLHPSIVW